MVTWTWIGGSNAINATGLASGSPNTEAANNAPSARTRFASFYDVQSKQFYVFGGLRWSGTTVGNYIIIIIIIIL